MAELADDTMADLVDHGGDVGVGRGLDREKAWLAPLVGTIEIDALQKNDMKMQVGVRRRLYLIV
jgi:hypothetical protein